MDLPADVLSDIGMLCDQLRLRGYSVSACETGPIHSYVVRFVGPAPLALICDRGQLFLEGEREELEPQALWRVYDDRTEFSTMLLRYLDRRAPR